MDSQSEIHRILMSLAKETREQVEAANPRLVPPVFGIESSSLDREPSNPGGERRRHPRYKCEGSTEFRANGSTVRTWATLTDLSCGGCYLEMHATFPQDTKVDLTIDVIAIRFRAKGIVRVTYPFLGMGIAFTEISEDDRALLDTVLYRLAGSAGEEIAAPPAAGPDVSRILDQSAALGEVARFFQSHKSLSREQFAELLRRYEQSSL